MNFFGTYVHPKAYQYVGQVMESGMLSEGGQVKLFEHEIQNRFRLMSATAVNSGTAALHLLLKAHGIGPRDEVIISAQTFVANGLAVLYCGAIPVFADIDMETGNISEHDILRKITGRTKAILLTHWGGLPANLDGIMTIAKTYGLYVFEDAAHALGARYKGKYIGEYPTDGGIFSFQAIKHLTTGDGGLIYSPSLETKMKELRWFGINRYNDLPDETGERNYNLIEIGYKYHMNDYAAALGRANLLGMEYVLGVRKQVAKLYTELLDSVWGVSLLKKNSDRESANWLFTILVEDREKFIKKMKSHDIPVSVVHVGIDRNAIFGGTKNLFNQRYWDGHQISLPLHHNLKEDEVEFICEKIKEGW